MMRMLSCMAVMGIIMVMGMLAGCKSKPAAAAVKKARETGARSIFGQGWNMIELNFLTKYYGF